MRIFVTEFADSKREIERKLSDSTDEVIEHLLKLYLMPTNSARNHWISEIANFLNKVNRFAGKNKFPSPEQIYNWTYFKWKDLVTDNSYMNIWVDNICDEYNTNVDKPIENICNEFDNICEQYFCWLASKLSVGGVVERQSIFKKLNSII